MKVNEMVKRFDSITIKFSDITGKDLNDDPMIFVSEELVKSSEDKIIRGRFTLCGGVWNFLVDSEEYVTKQGELNESKSEMKDTDTDNLLIDFLLQHLTVKEIAWMFEWATDNEDLFDRALEAYIQVQNTYDVYHGTFKDMLEHVRKNAPNVVDKILKRKKELLVLDAINNLEIVSQRNLEESKALENIYHKMTVNLELTREEKDLLNRIDDTDDYW